MSETPKTVFVTKYALTMGILERAALNMDDDGSVRVLFEGFPNDWWIFSPGEYATTKEVAVKQANNMRSEEIASLRKQIAKLEAMTFA